MFGIGILELIILTTILIIAWYVIAKRKNARSLKSKASGVSKKKSGNNNFQDTSSEDDYRIQHIEDSVDEHNDIIIGSEEIPLDNRYGSSTLVSEHEFARTATAHLKIEYNQDVTGRFKAGAWAVFEAEIKGNLSKTIGMEFGEQISRKVTLKFEAAAGKLVLYRVLWKQNTRKGKLSMAFGEKLIQIPYSITFGLHHSVESKDTQNIKQI